MKKLLPLMMGLGTLYMADISNINHYTKQAKEFYQKACDLKYEDGCKALAIVGADDEESRRDIVVFSMLIMFIVAIRIFYFRKKKRS